MEAHFLVFSNSVLVGGEWSALCTSCLNPKLKHFQ